MKHSVPCILFVFAVMLISPAFQCAEDISPTCEAYTQDSAILPINVPGNNAAFNVLDTIHIISTISDTIRTVKGKEFLSPINTLNINIQVYKIITTNNNSTLNYANVEFNNIVMDGTLENSPSQGYTFLYRRQQPNNTLKVSFVPGFRGLYLFVLRNSSTFGLNINEPDNKCAYYAPLAFINQSQQQTNYWDSLGTTSLRLSGSNSFAVANKIEKNYFFVRVD
jgi:hypothetical protein